MEDVVDALRSEIEAFESLGGGGGDYIGYLPKEHECNYMLG